MLAQEVIRHKRDGQQLSGEEIDFFIKGVADWSVSECQIAAFAMAVTLRGMTDAETALLTKAMTDSGEKMNWTARHLDGPVLDKNSTGGVGDKVSVVLAPVLAACGGYVPMVSGRGLGHTGGTLDKLDSIPGYSTLPSLEKLYDTVAEAGCAIIGQTGDLAPADKRLYAVRDVTGTVESIPLITASILSKKLCVGDDALVMDIKCGNGAFMRDIGGARELARELVSVAVKAGLPTRALITDMNQVMGESVGTAVEINEAIAYLKGEKRNSRLSEAVSALGIEALLLSGLAANREEAELKIARALDSGKAAERFAKMVAALGGPADLIEKPADYLPCSAIVRPVFAERSGYVESTDTRKIGASVLVLGGQRRTADQRIDYSVGFSDFAQIGDRVDSQRPLAVIHAQSEESFAEAERMLREAVEIGENAPVSRPVVRETVTV